MQSRSNLSTRIGIETVRRPYDLQRCVRSIFKLMLWYSTMHNTQNRLKHPTLSRIMTIIVRVLAAGARFFFSILGYRK